VNFLKTSFSFLQKIGKALMLPVAVLPIAGLMLGIGSAHFSLIPEIVSNIMAQSGSAIFGNLPLIFAIGTALGLANNDGVSALSAVVGYVVMLATMGVFAKFMGVEVKPVMGIDSINTGVFGGIAIGLIAAQLFNRYYRLELPPYLGFFSGKRSVPILTAGAAVIFGLVLSLFWPPIGGAIHDFSSWAAAGNPAMAFSLYGFVERLLIPFGLHHIWNVPFFFESGQYMDPKTGKILTGEIARYIGGDPSAGNLAGGYLFKMWGLPAAAIAIWRKARPENRLKIGGIMISAALTSFLTGITEPIEFSFMFVAPLLYLAHAGLCAAGFWLCIVLGIKHGMTFSHGLIDFLILYPESHRALWFFILGPIWACIYYAVFSFVIEKFDVKTPGREMETEAAVDFSSGGGDKADLLIAAFGGAANISDLDSCITRLRVKVVDPAKVNSEALKGLGATAVLTVADGVQAIFGTASENLKTDMDRRLAGKTASAVRSSAPAVATLAPVMTKVSVNVPQLLNDLGGKANIVSARAVAGSRVRVELKSPPRSDLSKDGVPAVQQIQSGVYHLIVGDQAAALAAQMMA
jgi:PTS system glucose-specific IIC component